MTVKVAYFQPITVAIDEVPLIEFSKMYALTEDVHRKPELHENKDPFMHIRGGKQIQIYPDKLNLNIAWLTKYLETICMGYMELVSSQSNTDELALCKPVITRIWTIRQHSSDYQEMHSHPTGNISGNIYVSVPDLAHNSHPSDGQISFRLPQTRDVSKFIMSDSWKYTPTTGTVIMFPSYLPHTVYPWKGDGSRTVLSFDAKLVPKDE